MIFSPLLLPLLTLTTTAHALYYHLEPFSATDIRIPSAEHYISFTVSNPEAVYEQGGNAKQNCTISWTGDAASPPECFSLCYGSGYSYYTRVVKGSYVGAYNFDLEVKNYYIYKNSALNSAVIPVRERELGYRCSRGGQSIICGYYDQPLGRNSSFTSVYGSVSPTPLCVNDAPSYV